MNIYLSNNIADKFMIKGVFKMPFKFLGSEVWVTDSILTMIVVVLILIIIGLIAKKTMKNPKEIPTGFQNVLEMIVEFVDNMCKGNFGDKGLNFANYIGTILLFIVFTILLSSTYSVNMLLKTAVDVKNDLNESIEKARKSVSYLVSRNTDELTESFIVSAVIESLTENITDSYVAPVFYFFIFGIIILINPLSNHLYYLLLVPMLYRASNTMDAMLGYKNDELANIGYVPAKLDDILNYIPARISGILVVVSAFLLSLDWKNSFNVMMRDARKCPSPNSGYTMASTAGALNIQLIKKDTYILGDDNKVIVADDISDAVKLSKLTIFLFTLIIIIIFTLIDVII